MQGRLLIVDDEKALVLAIKGLLSKEGYQIETAYSGEEAVKLIESGSFHVVITDLSLGGITGLDVLARARAVDPDVAVIMITAYGSEKVAVEAMKRGAADYLPKPFDNDELRVVVRRVMETALLRRDHRRLLEQVQGSYGFESIVGTSPVMQRIFATIDKIADTDVTVLIRGDSGTGKELVANALHYWSPRRAKPVLAMNCAALNRELVESELFGHEKGAFTGAVTRREGKFEAAHGGTLFLDEVGDMPLETQAKLLRAIQEKEFERVGGNHPIKVDVRLLAATNHDLEQLVREGRFREDLYYRLRVVEVVIPPLAERREDIPLLVDHFLKLAAKRFNREPKPLDGAALRACLTHAWRGNVRELRSAVEQALLLASGPEITAADLLPGGVVERNASSERLQPVGFQPESRNGGAASTGPAGPADASATGAARGLSFREAKEQLVGDFERRFLLDALRRNGGNITRAAEEVGMYRQSFQQKMRELGITPDDAA
ncbi:sigma-54 dependent transcriptional regulator [Candidatus Binatia bacterium]|nr:sigma-54 dependent transcriptional regulator [Candidatus Binatia bacterium]